MTNILVVTHGNLAKEFVNIAEDITQQKSKATAVCFDLGLDQANSTDKITDAIKSQDSSEPIIILTDLFGGSPSNISIPFVRVEKIEVITGLNLAMLLYLLTQTEDKGFEALCKGAKQAGKEAIIVAGEFLQ